MPERRGVQATEEIKAEWSFAYKIYVRAPGDRFDKKKDPGNETNAQTSKTPD